MIAQTLPPAPRPAQERRPVAARAQAPRRRLSPRMRKALVAAHVLVGVGWFGIVAAKLVLEIVAARTDSPDIARAGYVYLAALDRAAFPPAAVATILTGVVLSLGTAWGLFRHWWIVVKLVLSVAVVVTGVAFVGAWTEAALAADTVARSASGRLIGAAVAPLLMLGAATIISVFKPWGQIRPRRGVE
jgi:hypothetical protein